MNSNDFLQVRGELCIYSIPGEFFDPHNPTVPIGPEKLRALCANGRVIEHRYSNVIVDNGLSAVSRMLGSGLGFPGVGGKPVSSVADLLVTRMDIGTTLNPPAPTTSDTAISEAIPSYQINFLSVYYPTATSVRFAGVVPQSVTALNGQALTEEGLFLANGAMIAHVTFAPEVKIPTHAIQLEHTITISRP
jgi:hypothetical protein